VGDLKTDRLERGGFSRRISITAPLTNSLAATGIIRPWSRFFLLGPGLVGAHGSEPLRLAIGLICSFDEASPGRKPPQGENSRNRVRLLFDPPSRAFSEIQRPLSLPDQTGSQNPVRSMLTA